MPVGTNLEAGSAEEAARSAEAGLHFVELSLRENGRDWSDVALVQLFVRDMSTFGQRGPAGGAVDPTPASASNSLARNAPVAMDVLVGVGSGASAGNLHVQSVSCWAPACRTALRLTHLGLTHVARS